MTRAPLASAPREPVDIPRRVERLAAGEEIEPVWRNEAGGLTFRLGDSRFVKWDARTPLAHEAERLAWVGQYARVPEVLDLGSDDEGHWLVTRALDGASSIDGRWVPEVAVVAIAKGLREFHDRVPVDECPFEWSVEERTERADARSGTSTRARRSLHNSAPTVDRLVVCHGDACAPNTLIAPDGQFLAHVDLGRAGRADRWADLAVASWSLEWNFGSGFDRLFFDAYGVEADPERVAFYRALWDAT